MSICLAQDFPDFQPGPPGPTAAESTAPSEASNGRSDTAQRLDPQERAVPAASSSAALRAAAAALSAGLNDDQRLAVQRVLGGADYSLVLGMPGTGKTSLIVAAVRGV